VEQWFQNTRGLVIIVLAVITGAVLLAIEPGDGFPSGASSGAGVDTATVTTVTTQPLSTTTTAVVHPTLQEGSTGPDVTVLQQRLNALGYNVGAPDGNFGPGTKTQVIAFQTAQKISPADGVVNAATWNALLANPSTSTPATTTTVKP
jgi:peptidoglycan hydrolase-like protein with peptidoglycan-binding domain